jgi:hypothetical protein
MGGAPEDTQIMRLQFRSFSQRLSMQAGLRWTKVAQSLYERVRYRRIIMRMHLAACTPCQYDCVDCSHAAMLKEFKGYQLSLDHVREFINFTEQSHYLIKQLHLTGPGEPLLWRNLEEGLRLLRGSRAIQRIALISNGLNLQRIDNDMWNNIDQIHVSVYPAFKKVDDVLAALEPSHKKKLRIVRTTHFRTAPRKGEVAAIPCVCDCTGPMYFDRKVFFYCGPTVFGAAESKGVSVLDYPEMYEEIGLDYLKRMIVPQSRVERIPILSRVLGTIDPIGKTAAHELCRYCFANNNREFVLRDHVALPNGADSA